MSLNQVDHRAIRVACEPVSSGPNVADAIAAVTRQADPAVLDSSRHDLPGGRYSILACNPVAVASFDAGSDPFEGMRRLLAATGMLPPAVEPPCPVFAGGWIGYFAYEAGRFIERLPAATERCIDLPLARFALYDSAAVYDHHAGQWTVAATELPSTESRPIAQRLNWWRDLLARASRAESAAAPQLNFGPVVQHTTPGDYMDMVSRAREYIAAGDIFQVNLTRRESMPAAEPPLELYLRLREANPGAYSAFLQWLPESRSPCAILSSSPELFVDVVGREVLTRPIKGTRPRSLDAAVDASLCRELAGSEKDRAELAMIVDLERNDLGRVCEFGSVRVLDHDSPAAPYAIERHATVHHLVASVAGRLAPDEDIIDLLRAAFPGGSITGAPKVRAMQIIDELEPCERSAYTGAIGYFAPGGRMTMNIAIRTMIQADGRLHWYAGGGIVADSQPAAEYEETVAKALGMRQAAGVEDVCRIQKSTADRS